MKTDNKEFVTFLITMIIGGLTYSIASFSYMHSTFTTKDIMEKQKERIDRTDLRIDKRLSNIESKIDILLKDTR